MNTPVRQQGITLWGMMVIMAVAAIFILVTLKLLPVYYQQFKLVKALHSTKTELSEDSASPGEIRRKLSEKFVIDDIDVIEADEIQIVTTDTGLQIIAEVDVRQHLVGNISLVVTVNESVDIP